MIIELCHEKTDLKVFVIVIPKEGLAGYKVLLYCLHRLYPVVGVILKEGLVGPQPANPSLGMTTTKTLRSVCLFSRDARLLCFNPTAQN